MRSFEMGKRLLQYKHILFDLDGTLFDTQWDLKHAWKQVISSYGKNLDNFEEIYRIGPPLQEIVKVLLPDLSIDEQSEAIEKFKSLYDYSEHERTAAYKWMTGYLNFLHENNCKLYVVTNKRIYPTRYLVEKNNWSNLFTAIYTPDLHAGKIYKKHETIALLKQAFSIDSNSAVMVGDTSGDIIAGKKNAISTAGVTWGYGTKEELVQSQCDILLSEKDFEQWL